jgi:hypothetical protein
MIDEKTGAHTIWNRENKMASQVDSKSLFIGLLVGLILLLVVGAGRDEGDYRLSMAASGDWVVYGKINTVTGEVDTWTYVLHSSEIPRAPKKRD